MKKKAVSEMTTYELIQELRSREEIVAVQVWQKDDLLNAFGERGIVDPGENLFRRAAQKCGAIANNCSAGWEIMSAAVQEALEKM